VEEREEEREKKHAISLQPVYAQKSRNFVREDNGLCINSGELTTYG
jgi:hypothetical protein